MPTFPGMRAGWSTWGLDSGNQWPKWKGPAPIVPPPRLLPRLPLLFPCSLQVLSFQEHGCSCWAKESVVGDWVVSQESGRAAVTSVVITAGLMTAHQAENHGDGTPSPLSCPFLLTLCRTEHFSAFAHLSLRLPLPVCPTSDSAHLARRERFHQSFLPSPLSPDGFCGDREGPSCLGCCPAVWASTGLNWSMVSFSPAYLSWG